MSKKCYSLNDDDFNHDELGDLFDELEGNDELIVGHVYYEADCHVPSTDNALDVAAILEAADEQMYDLIGEVYDNAFGEASPDARDELKALLNIWAEKHVSLDRYWVIDGKTREMRVTEDDVKEHGNG